MNLHQQFIFSYYSTAYIAGAIVFILTRVSDGASAIALVEGLIWPIMLGIRLVKRLLGKK